MSYKERFLQDPTDTAAASAYFEDTRALAHFALKSEQMSTYWDLSQQMKIIGKFLPLDDPRNPDCQVDQTISGQQG